VHFSTLARKAIPVIDATNECSLNDLDGIGSTTINRARQGGAIALDGLSYRYVLWTATAGLTCAVCTENLIQIDKVMESPKLAE
jgi:hypothetical protein